MRRSQQGRVKSFQHSSGRVSSCLASKIIRFLGVLIENKQITKVKIAIGQVPGFGMAQN